MPTSPVCLRAVSIAPIRRAAGLQVKLRPLPLGTHSAPAEF